MEDQNHTCANAESEELTSILSALGLDEQEPTHSCVPPTNELLTSTPIAPHAQQQENADPSPRQEPCDVGKREVPSMPYSIIMLFDAIVTPGTLLHGLAVFFTVLAVIWFTLAYVVPIFLAMLAECISIIAPSLIIFVGILLCIRSLFRH